ncbi:CheR family methyltransferase [Saccharophagus degradans]|uniref:protein-glutamate O-methyltransferase n=2 Tax=Saccharophagus degradans TaxID=86304 RepID=Q21EJ4_SACD2|nr:CheR family methyltransferase [Saccharophagus degradans]ABD82885.1 Protein-glutamate O-methyltransferase [Saccharophagus degradans 2-40]MBU2985017.1 protein-glutamate O-methyltransferase CheR [Saccharophagus degradans]MDO6423564.1 CheR family methyltransferase [Saccharophagus degradans]MDO6607764.1 CheR family methyltransferase [Saccharophagus degradans]WGO98931.1 CheR family methyltransferase [Saccharophagus degradans]
MIWSLQAAPDLSDKQFTQWSKLLEERAGICLSDQQRVFLQTQVTMRMRELGHSDYTQYLNRVTDGVSGMMEWSVLIDRLVVKETSFFRHKPSIDFVRDTVLDRMNQNTLEGSFDVWSVGCSSGEEPYSLAMVLNDTFEFAQRDPYYGVTATDISRAALTIARTGLYPQRKVEMIEPHFRQRYFSPQEKNRYQIQPELKDRVCFNHGNVLNITDMPVISMDVIFCQNMLVYFRRWLRHEIMNAFVDRLKPGGILVVGLGEVVDWVHPDMVRVPVEEVQAYRRK